MNPNLELPTDIWLLIFNYLSVLDILRLRQTCVALSAVTRLDSIWSAKLYALNVIEGTTMPRRDLSNQNPESCVRRTLLLQRNWTSQQPQPTHSATIETIDRRLATNDNSAYFLRGCNSRYLFTYERKAIQRGVGGQLNIYRIWDLHSASSLKPKCVALLKAQDPAHIVFNQDFYHPTSAVVYQGTMSKMVFYELRLESTEASEALVPIGCLSEKANLYPVYLKKSTLLCIDGSENLWLYHVSSFGNDVIVTRVGLLESSSTSQQTPLLAESVQDHFAVVIRRRSIELYLLPSVIIGQQPSSSSHILPISSYDLPRGIETVCISPARVRGAVYLPLSLIVRFEDPSAWVANVIQQFVILPSFEGGVPPPGADIMRAVPYDLKPVFVQQWSSPIKLIMPAPIALNTHGTVLWLDSGPKKAVGERSRQRVAARALLHFDRSISGEELEELASQLRQDKQSLPFHPPAESEIRVIDARDRRLTSHGWVDVALAEEDGLIALVSEDGTVTVHDYTPLS